MTELFGHSEIKVDVTLKNVDSQFIQSVHSEQKPDDTLKKGPQHDIFVQKSINFRDIKKNSLTLYY